MSFPVRRTFSQWNSLQLFSGEAIQETKTR
jgi:hypothetical protein